MTLELKYKTSASICGISFCEATHSTSILKAINGVRGMETPITLKRQTGKRGENE